MEKEQHPRFRERCSFFIRSGSATSIALTTIVWIVACPATFRVLFFVGLFPYEADIPMWTTKSRMRIAF